MEPCLGFLTRGRPAASRLLCVEACGEERWLGPSVVGLLRGSPLAGDGEPRLPKRLLGRVDAGHGPPHLAAAVEPVLRRSLELVVTRIATLGIGAAVVSAVAVGVAVRVFQPAQLWAFAAVAVLLGLTYGVVGVVVGLLFDELGGVYVMLLVPLVDVLLFQNPLASDLPGWTEYLPGHHATAALFDAAFTATVEVGTVLGAVGYAALLTGLCVVVFGRVVRVES